MGEPGGRLRMHGIRAVATVLLWAFELTQPVHAQPVAVGAEFQVNTFTETVGLNVQINPAIACDMDGDVVVAWQGPSTAGFEPTVFHQRVDTAGNVVGTEFEFPGGSCDERDSPSACRDAAGNSVVVWNDLSDGSATGIVGRRFDSSGTPVGAPFQVNSYTESGQGSPSVGCTASGDFVVVWRSNGQDGYNNGVFARQFTSSATSVGSDFQVNTHTEQGQSEADIAVAGDGSFVVVWQGQGGYNPAIFGQRFTSSATLIGTEFQVNSYTLAYQSQPTVAADAAGEFVVVWTTYGLDGHSNGVFGQRFASSGVPAGAEFLVNSYTMYSQNAPDVHAESDGDFVVVWASPDGDASGIFGRQFASSGTPIGSDFQINTFTQSNQFEPVVAAGPGGGFVVTWSSGDDSDGSGSGVFARRFTSTAVMSGTEFQVNTYTPTYQNHPAIAGSSTGFAIVWHGFDPDAVTPADNVFTTFYDSAGDPIVGDVEVSPLTCTRRRDPDVCQGADGDFVVVYTTRAGNDGDSIFAQRFASGGAAVGAEFMINAYTGFGHADPSVACEANGDFVVVWNATPTNADDIFGRRFDSGGMALGTEFQINTYTHDNYSRGAAAIGSDAAGGFVVVWLSQYQDGFDGGVFGQRFDSGGARLGTEFLVNTVHDLRTGVARGGRRCRWRFRRVLAERPTGRRHRRRHLCPALQQRGIA